MASRRIDWKIAERKLFALLLAKAELNAKTADADDLDAAAKDAADFLIIGDTPVISALPARKAENLNLPLVRYQKTITCAFHDDGTVSIIIADLRSRAYLSHFLLMAQKYLLPVGGKASVYRAELPAAYEPAYAGLKDFVLKNSASFKSPAALVIGYPGAFMESWKSITETA